VADAYLLDTCTIIAAMKGEPHALLNRLAALAPNRLHMSGIVLSELLYGAEKSQRAAHVRSALDIVTQGFSALPFEAADAEAYGRIRAVLERKGASIGPLDLLIAAQAVAHNLVLVTDNLREFRRVPGLRCENWTRGK
jgi:tRNA(fMet)-specific endonuclease VapC